MEALMSDKIILVTGATGLQGGSVARHLLGSARYSVRALTRDRSSQPARVLAAAGAKLVQGDLGDSDSLTRAMDGCYGAFGVTDFWEHQEEEYHHGKNLADAAAAAGIEHLVLSTLPSVAKVDPSLDVPHFETKARVERYARELGIPVTFVHVAFYYENFLSYFVPRRQDDNTFVFGFPQGDTPLAAVAVEDLGGLVEGIFKDRERFAGTTVGAVGDDRPPAAYAEIMSRVLGERVSYNHIPREVFAAFDFPGADDLANMFEFNRLHVPGRQGDLDLSRKLYPKMRSFDSWMEANVGRFGAAMGAD
jgi:uncharacterized protein YbjT (DUF2867 family)